jgi:hypothetical protein
MMTASMRFERMSMTQLLPNMHKVPFSAVRTSASNYFLLHLTMILRNQ